MDGFGGCLFRLGDKPLAVVEEFFDNRPHGLWDRLGFDAGVVNHLSSGQSVEDGKTFLRAAGGFCGEGVAEPEEDIVDPVEAARCPPGGFTSLVPEDAEDLALLARDEGAWPGVRHGLFGEHAGVENVCFAVGCAREHGVDDGGPALKGLEDRHVVGSG